MRLTEPRARFSHARLVFRRSYPCREDGDSRALGEQFLFITRSAEPRQTARRQREGELRCPDAIATRGPPPGSAPRSPAPLASPYPPRSDRGALPSARHSLAFPGPSQNTLPKTPFPCGCRSPALGAEPPGRGTPTPRGRPGAAPLSRRPALSGPGAAATGGGGGREGGSAPPGCGLGSHGDTSCGSRKRQCRRGRGCREGRAGPRCCGAAGSPAGWAGPCQACRARASCCRSSTGGW